MTRSRKDNKGRVLRKGESQRKSDLMYLYVYTEPYSKKRRYIYAKDLMKLREREKEIQRNQIDCIDGYAGENTDLNTVFDRYMSTKTELRLSTYSRYTWRYNYYIRETLGKQKIGTIKYSDVLRFYQYLIKVKQIKIGSLKAIHTILHPAFQMAVRDGIIRSNPSDDVMAEITKKMGKAKKARHPLTSEQTRVFMNYVSKHPVYTDWLPLFTVLLGTGCRVGEVTGLRWCDIDFERRVININHSLIYFSENGETKFHISMPKTEAGNRNIPMLEEVYQALKVEEQRKKVSRNKKKVAVDGMTDFIFFNRIGNLYSDKWINNTIYRIVTSYNNEEIKDAEKEKREPVILPKFTCHHLRHTFCCRLCEVETNVKAIQEIMGHSTIEITLNIYAEATEQKKKETIEKLSNNLQIF